MRIKVTEIEADAKELRESQTLSQNLIKILTRALQTHVEGYIETVTVSPNMTIICNEEGRIRNLPYNCRLCGIDFVGTIIIAGVDDADLTDVPISFDTYKRLLLEAKE